MNPEYWLKRWRRGQTGWHLPHPNPMLVKYWPALSISQDAKVFVPLCGKSVDMHWLQAQGHEVLGAELSLLAIQQFFDQFGWQAETTHHTRFVAHHAERCTLLEVDFFQLQADDLTGVSAVYDRAALVAFPPVMRPQYIAHLKRIVPVGSKLLLITLESDAVNAEDGPPFSVPEDEVRRLLAPMVQLECVEALQMERKGQKWCEKVWIGQF
jgi:thiopurine S-methyltransferase